MAKYNKTDVVTGDTVKSDINVQLGLIESSITDTLSLSGDTPNSMLADFDMNSNDILNAGTINANALAIDGLQLTATVGAIDISANYAWTGTHTFLVGSVTGVGITDLVEVVADTPASGDIMYYNGAAWVLTDISTFTSSAITDPFAITKHTSASILVAGVVNELTVAGTYTLPLAASVAANYSLIVELSDKDSALNPIVQIDGSDTITDSAGTDTSVTLDAGSVSLRFVSDGTSDWRI